MKKLVIFVLSLSACTPFGPNKTGDNGKGAFRYECSAATDPTCQGAVVDQSFPTQIALGSVFAAGFISNDVVQNTADSVTNSTTASTLQSAATRLLRFESGHFHAVANGYAGVIALNSSGRVVDFTHVLIAPPTSLAILRDSTTPALAVMKVGDSQTVFASPLDENGLTIAGAVPATWAVSDSGVLQLVETSPAVTMPVNAKAVGTATLTVTASGVTRTLTITVEAP